MKQNNASTIMILIDALWDDAGYMGGNHAGEGPDPYPLFVCDTLRKMAQMTGEEYWKFVKKTVLMIIENEEEE